MFRHDGCAVDEERWTAPTAPGTEELLVDVGTAARPTGGGFVPSGGMPSPNVRIIDILWAG
ncbi:hypothetical protein GCM10027589_17110 [Actinocorallia lasiicapitis]